MSDSLQPTKPTKLLCPWGFSQQEYWSGLPFPSPGDLPKPGIKPRSPALQVDSWSALPQWKPKNTGVGSLPLLQGIFPTQESNQGLLHCRWSLYQLSYEGSPVMMKIMVNKNKTENSPCHIIELQSLAQVQINTPLGHSKEIRNWPVHIQKPNILQTWHCRSVR